MSTVGVIDTLSAGFDRVTKRLWLLLVPVLVDVGIWIGPRLSINKLSQAATAALPSVAELGSQYQESLELVRDWLADLGAGANLLSMLSMRALGLPSLTGTYTPKAGLFTAAQRVVEVQTWPGLLGLAALLTLLSLLIGCFCLSWLAQEARDEEINIAYTLQVAGRSWVRLATLVFLGLLTVAMGIIGASVTYSVLAVLNPQLAWLILSVLGVGSVWITVYAGIVFFFTPSAIVLDNIGIVHSLWSSLNVVHRNFFSAIAFILLVNIIQAGLLYIWRLLAVSTVGTLVGIVGNAYVSTGLVMASFIFYRDKFVAWQEAIRQAEMGKGQP
jgi:hypothetical protein